MRNLALGLKWWVEQEIVLPFRRELHGAIRVKKCLYSLCCRHDKVLCMAVSQIIADTNYVAARLWTKDGRDLLEKGLREKRMGDFDSARESMNCALKHFREAIDRYANARRAAPAQKMQDKFRRKMNMLKNSDVACAMNAIRRMEPKAEPPMDDVRRRLGAKNGDEIFPFPSGGLI